jgi:hypothetical protein
LIGAAAKGELLLVLPCIDRLSGKSQAFCFPKSFLPPKARKRVILVRKPLLFLLAAYSHLVAHHVGNVFTRQLGFNLEECRHSFPVAKTVRRSYLLARHLSHVQSNNGDYAPGNSYVLSSQIERGNSKIIARIPPSKNISW